MLSYVFKFFIRCFTRFTIFVPPLIKVRHAELLQERFNSFMITSPLITIFMTLKVMQSIIWTKSEHLMSFYRDWLIIAEWNKSVKMF